MARGPLAVAPHPLGSPPQPPLGLYCFTPRSAPWSKIVGLLPQSPLASVSLGVQGPAELIKPAEWHLLPSATAPRNICRSLPRLRRIALPWNTTS